VTLAHESLPVLELSVAGLVIRVETLEALVEAVSVDKNAVAVEAFANPVGHGHTWVYTPRQLTVKASTRAAAGGRRMLRHTS
jgi:hypothetical protein